MKTRLQPDVIIDDLSKPLLAPKITFGGLDRDMAQEKLDLFQLASSLMESRAQVRRRWCGAITPMPHREAAWRTMDQITFAVNPQP